MNADMSKKAVTTRIRRVSQLRRLCLTLGKARIISPPPTAPAKR